MASPPPVMIIFVRSLLLLGHTAIFFSSDDDDDARRKRNEKDGMTAEEEEEEEEALSRRHIAGRGGRGSPKLAYCFLLRRSAVKNGRKEGGRGSRGDVALLAVTSGGWDSPFPDTRL